MINERKNDTLYSTKKKDRFYCSDIFKSMKVNTEICANHKADKERVCRIYDKLPIFNSSK